MKSVTFHREAVSGELHVYVCTHWLYSLVHMWMQTHVQMDQNPNPTKAVTCKQCISIKSILSRWWMLWSIVFPCIAGSSHVMQAQIQASFFLHLHRSVDTYTVLTLESHVWNSLKDFLDVQIFSKFSTHSLVARSWLLALSVLFPVFQIYLMALWY